ncbi:hypothetical protein ACG33_09490 [Steroidobacter denitrificans]|uniref:Uncharacterized protein n=1 Tax=Steroidobacter denitrificans TaxID=465721 RepID=A0A127FA75_STEDE|nr:hypothetical protein ACG33_09490 [Steroidobacter denitrificans]
MSGPAASDMRRAAAAVGLTGRAWLHAVVRIAHDNDPGHVIVGGLQYSSAPQAWGLYRMISS